MGNKTIPTKPKPNSLFNHALFGYLSRVEICNNAGVWGRSPLERNKIKLISISTIKTNNAQTKQLICTKEIQSGPHGDSWAPPACHRSVQLVVWVWHWNCLSSTFLTYEPGPRMHPIRMKYFCDWPKLEKQPLPCEGGSGIRMCCCVWERVEPRKRIFVVATEIYFLKNLSHHSCKLQCLCIKHVPLQGNWKPNRQSSTFLNIVKGLCRFMRTLWCESCSPVDSSLCLTIRICTRIEL